MRPAPKPRPRPCGRGPGCMPLHTRPTDLAPLVRNVMIVQLASMWFAPGMAAAVLAASGNNSAEPARTCRCQCTRQTT